MKIKLYRCNICLRPIIPSSHLQENWWHHIWRWYNQYGFDGPEAEHNVDSGYPTVAMRPNDWYLDEEETELDMDGEQGDKYILMYQAYGGNT